MKGRFFPLILLLTMLPGLLVPRRAEASGSPREDRLVAALEDFFAGAEGDYHSVNPDDNGALSLGLLQWHGPRALELLRQALEGWPVTANYLTPALYREITQPDTEWQRRRLSQGEAACISALLGSPGGIAAQEALARRDILSYLALARELGMESDATAAYFAVIVNQFGAAGARDYLRHIRATLGLGEEAVFRDLTALHQAVHDTRDYGQACLSMRDKSYAYILSLGWPVREDPAPGLQALTALGEGSGPLRLLLGLLCRILGLLEK